MGKLLGILISMVLLSQVAVAQLSEGYSILGNDSLRDEGLKREILSIISQRQKSRGYTEARKELLGHIALKREGGTYYVKDVYCEKKFYPGDFKSRPVGPNEIPHENILNTEHTWPQSRFNRSIQKDIQKADLHHLYPSDSELNSIRGNFKFGNVNGKSEDLKCPTSRRGRNGSGEFIFEPPAAHKGNVARALFYFSIRYDLQIDSDEESDLRRWAADDPADEEEKTRNDMIEKFQGNRNPFIDDANLYNRISNF